MRQLEFREMFRRELNNFPFAAAQFHGLLQLDAFEFRSQRAFYWTIRNVSQFRADRQLGRFVFGA